MGGIVAIYGGVILHLEHESYKSHKYYPLAELGRERGLTSRKHISAGMEYATR